MRSKKYDDVPANDWQTWAEENKAIILDVREPNEWRQGTLPDSELISMRDLPARVSDFDKNTAILCVCRSGNRSGQVAAFLSHNGYGKVANLVGGLKALGMQR